jgi:hypothetical protein
MPAGSGIPVVERDDGDVTVGFLDCAIDQIQVPVAASTGPAESLENAT